MTILDSLSTPAYQSFKKELEEKEELSEQNVSSLEGRYKDLDRRALYTSFEDLESIFQNPYVSGTWLDLGGGSGRTCLLYSFLTGNESINVEIDEARAKIASELADSHQLTVRNFCEDLLDCLLPLADTYFLYFPTGHVLDRVLDVLSKRVDFTLVVIESHGDLIPRIEKEKGYELVDQVLLKTPRHHPFAQIYRKRSVIDYFSPHKISFKYDFLIFKDSLGEWVADSFGLEWEGGDHYKFLNPPRSVMWSEDFVGFFDDSHPLYGVVKEIAHKRREGTVEVILKNSEVKTGFIRKVRLSPTFSLEISTGELIEWNQIQKLKGT